MGNRRGCFSLTKLAGLVACILGNIVVKGDTTVQIQMDNDLIEIATRMSALGIDTTLQQKADQFQADVTDEGRDSLKTATMAAIARASSDVISNLIDPQSTNVIPALVAWNNDGTNNRQPMCNLISQPSSLVSQDVKDCMCGSTDPYIRCLAMLGSTSFQYHVQRRRQRERKLRGSSLPTMARKDGVTKLLRKEMVEQRKLQECSLEFTPSTLGLEKPTLTELLQIATDAPVGVGVSGECCIALEPPPLDLFEICGAIEISIPDYDWLNSTIAEAEVLSGNIVKGSDKIKQDAASIQVSVALKLCTILESVVGKKDAEILQDILDFLGIDPCFASLGFDVWPVQGHAQIQLELTLGIFFANAGVRWQLGTSLRDVLGLCDGVVPSCGDDDNRFCTLQTGEVLGYLTVGLNFLIWSPSVTLDVGDHAYDNCDKWADGTTCLLGTSCSNCNNTATYWYGSAFTKCGEEPKYPDGTLCLLGTSCNSCQNSATFWYGPAITMCGDEPKYPDGTTCLIGTSCNVCENSATFWYGPAITKCGDEPKYPDGTTCLDGTSCNNCENAATYWYGPAITKCGDEPKYPDGTTCLIGTSCNVCMNPQTYWYGPAITKCGDEPKYPDGTTCLDGTSCNNCENAATYWYGPAITKCGNEPKYPDGTTCLAGTSCNNCENAATFWLGPAITKCGNEPCWPDGTDCLAGTTCSKCCNTAYTNLGTQCGGSCWGGCTACGIGTTCNLCCNGYSWQVCAFFTACN